MSSGSTTNPGRGLRLLALDGGGIKGLSELLILQDIMLKLQEELSLPEVPRPAEFFDLIGGTSTGGLIAILLGRLGLSVKEAIDIYADLSEKIFDASSVSRATSTVAHGHRFDAVKLQEAICEIVKACTGDEDTAMITASPQCLVFVTAVPALSASTTRLFRTYNSPLNGSHTEVKIWEAGRATAAATTFFAPMEIGPRNIKEVFIDAGISGFNNPTEVLLQEVREDIRDFRSKDIACLVSIGTGREDTIHVPSEKDRRLIDKWKNVAPTDILQALKALATSCYNVHQRVDRESSLEGKYIRLEVDQGNTTVSMEEWEKLGAVATYTNAYLGHSETRRKTKHVVSLLAATLDANHSQKCRKWLSTVPYQYHHAFIASRNLLKSSGMWLYTCPEFTSWASSNEPTLLWLHGLEGCGKSVLAHMIIEDRKATTRMIYFYCSNMASESARADPEEILRCIVKQLSQKSEGGAISEVVAQKYKVALTKAEQDDYELMPLTSDECVELIKALLAQQETIVVIDGLDECKAAEVYKLTKAIHELLEFARSARPPRLLKWLITSRNESYISSQMRQFPSYKIKEADTGLDVERFIDDQVQQIVRDDRLLPGSLSTALVTKIRRVLKKKAHGRFQQARLHIDALCDPDRMRTEADVEAALEKLPEGIKKSYDALLGRVGGLSVANQEFVMNTLIWLYCAQAQLEVPQLIDALSRTQGSTAKIPAKHELLSICSGLVDWDKGLDVFRPSHPSVLDYLGEIDGFHLRAHTTVFTTCLRVCSDHSNRAGDFLYQYSTVYWPAHLSYIGGDIEDVATRSELRSFVFCEDVLSSKSNKTMNRLIKVFKPGRKGPVSSPPFTKWIGDVGKLYNQLRQSDGSQARLRASIAGNLTPIFLASTFGFLWMFQLFHAACPKLDLGAKNRDGSTAFELACMYGSASIVGYLLDRKSQPRARDLVRAAENGHAPVVRIIVTRTMIDVNATNGWWRPRTPLLVAAKNGHAAVVEVLLGANKIVADFAPSKGVTPLIQAAKYGHDDVVTALIERGRVDVNKSDGKGNTALMMAIRHGHANIVEILLSRPNIEVQSQNTNGDTPLSNAIISGNQEIFETLLTHEATNINFQDAVLGRTPMLWAARNGNLSFVELLSKRRGIRVDMPDFKGRTALSWAAGEGFPRIVELLSSRSDVSINSSCKLGRTPISYAASYGAVEAIQVLLGLPEIQPGVSDRDARTPLSWAAQGLQTYTGHAFGRQLIALGVATGFLRVMPSNRGDLNAMIPAVHQARLDTLSLLLAQESMDMNETDNHGRTPLSWAAGGGCEEAVKFLLSQQNIQANVADDDGHDAMWHAQKSGYSALAKLLSTDGQLLPPEEIQESTWQTRIVFEGSFRI